MQRQHGIAGVGCALLDILHTDANISGAAFARYASRSPGDGGLVPGNLVFAEALEAFAGVGIEKIVADVCAGAQPATNLGGPAVVALVHAAQVLAPVGLPVRYFGIGGDDEVGAELSAIVAKTPLVAGDYRRESGPSPNTRVLSDPLANGGAGERTFINTIGVAERFRARSIPAEFFAYDVAFFGGTALVPTLHAELGEALRSSKRRGQLTVVATVYDFLNESRAPNELWPLGDGQRDYPLVDLMICDAEEARRLTGEAKPVDAVRQLLAWGAGAAIVTEGDRPVTLAAAGGGAFVETEVTTLPVSDEVRRLADTVDASQRDTTGCGDNFAGGVVAEITRQLAGGGSAGAAGGATRRPVDLTGAVIEGICAGAAAWFQLGGTWVEPAPGAAIARLAPFREAYRRQVGPA